MDTWTSRLTLDTADETAAFGARIAPLVGVGDTLLLAGEVGSGKSTLARALIRTRLADPQAEVPSPSFTLVQTYDAPGLAIWHVDLYRLSGPESAVELGLDQAFERSLCLVEWPDRLGPFAPPGALWLTLQARDGDHLLTLHGPRTWAGRLGSAIDRP